MVNPKPNIMLEKQKEALVLASADFMSFEKELISMTKKLSLDEIDIIYYWSMARFGSQHRALIAKVLDEIII